MKPWAENPKTITKAAAKRLLTSWKEYGQVQTIAVSPSLVVLDGHQRLNVLLAAYGSDYVIDARQASRELSEDEQKRLVVLLHAGAVGAWDWDSLSGWSAPDLMEWGMDSEALAGWKRDVAALGNLLESEKPTADAEPQVDRAAELLEKWQVKPGDLWRIGDHRLLCGDSTKREDVEMVMGGEKAELICTDPPYKFEPYGGGAAEALISDRHKDALQPLTDYDAGDLFSIFELLDFGSAAIWCNKELLVPYLNYAIDKKYKWNIFVWAKNGVMPFNHNTFHSDVEYCVYMGTENRHFENHLQNSNYSRWFQSDARMGRRESDDLHPTVKPLEFITRIVEVNSPPKGIVADFYLGSGTTMVACENLHRRCRAIEISPAYCSVILERMATAFPELAIERL